MSFCNRKEILVWARARLIEIAGGQEGLLALSSNRFDLVGGPGRLICLKHQAVA
jgi:hypothetical protein